MKFRSTRQREEPDINLIPLIDILIVVLIFLFLTTTYSRFAELQINLPEASAEKPGDRPRS
jgi:biopolymer transport protein ExbD